MYLRHLASVFFTVCCNMFFAINSSGGELGRRTLPLDSIFKTPTTDERDAVYEWISNWELFPFLNDPYVMSVEASREYNSVGKMPMERFSINSFIVAESREESMVRVLFEMEDPIQSELQSQDPSPKARGFMAPRRSASIDFFRHKDKTFCKDGEEEIAARAAGNLDPFRVCCSMGVFLPEHIGLNNVAGKETVVGRPVFHVAYKKDTMIGILEENGFVIAHWEHVYEKNYRLNTYIYFKDELPVYFQNGTTNGPVGSGKKLRSQGFAAVEWTKTTNHVSVPARLHVVSDTNIQGSVYELDAKIKWKVDKEVNPKFLDKKEVGRLTMSDF